MSILYFVFSCETEHFCHIDRHDKFLWLGGGGGKVHPNVDTMLNLDSITTHHD